jgi:hypothetical protein
LAERQRVDLRLIGPAGSGYQGRVSFEPAASHGFTEAGPKGTVHTLDGRRSNSPAGQLGIDGFQLL